MGSNITAQRLLDASLAPNTVRVYTNAIKALRQFCLFHHKTFSLPIDVDTLSQFIVHLCNQQISHSSITTYLSAIAHEHKMHGLQSPTNAFIIHKLLTGYRRLSGHTHDTRRPITVNLLESIVNSLQHVCYDTYECLLFSAAFNITFFALLRISEVAVSSHLSLGYALRFTDVTMLHDKVCITIRQSKTDQVGKSTKLCVSSYAKHTICPVHTMKQYLCARPNTTNPILFCHKNGASLSQFQFSSVLAKSLTHLGIYEHYSSHSFRIGAATTAANRGVPHHLIQKWGRWSSDAYKRYIR